MGFINNNAESSSVQIQSSQFKVRHYVIVNIVMPVGLKLPKEAQPTERRAAEPKADPVRAT